MLHSVPREGPYLPHWRLNDDTTSITRPLCCQTALSLDPFTRARQNKTSPAQTEPERWKSFYWCSLSCGPYIKNPKVRSLLPILTVQNQLYAWRWNREVKSRKTVHKYVFSAGGMLDCSYDADKSSEKCEYITNESLLWDYNTGLVSKKRGKKKQKLVFCDQKNLICSNNMSPGIPRFIHITSPWWK